MSYFIALYETERLDHAIAFYQREQEKADPREHMKIEGLSNLILIAEIIKERTMQYETVVHVQGTQKGDIHLGTLIEDKRVKARFHNDIARLRQYCKVVVEYAPLHGIMRS